MGGEKRQPVLRQPSDSGSPPRRRGKGDFHIVTHTKVGITPAWAGKSLGYWERSFFQRGSPPHGRGKVTLPIMQFDRDRITPAWAGKRLKLWQLLKIVGDHPRMGGEKTL